MTTPLLLAASRAAEIAVEGDSTPAPTKHREDEWAEARAETRVQTRAELRTVVVVSGDAPLRHRLAASLTSLRWRVREASGGAQAMLHLEMSGAESMLVDSWLPDLEVGEFTAQARMLYPEMELLCLDDEAGEESNGSSAGEGERGRTRGLRRHELLCAIREVRAGTAKPADFTDYAGMRQAEAYRVQADGSVTDGSVPLETGATTSVFARAANVAESNRRKSAGPATSLPELVGGSPAMTEVARLVRLVAPRMTTVLIEGETGTGKEVVARALHQLSPRAGRLFAVLNCAAIPEPLLEAELFGHTRGAFTGAVQSRVGRIEAAQGGTLLLDEIGEMPLGMQAKVLRFLDSGELQRVGENETRRVDVRVIAATHQPLEQRSLDGSFRLDLYHRLAVFPIEIPPLRERLEDLGPLAEHFLEQMGRDSPRKRLAPGALEKLGQHSWPGNVRELKHVLERAAILAGGSPEIAAEEIRYRRMPRN